MAQSIKPGEKKSINARLLELIRQMKKCERAELVKMLEDKKNGEYRNHYRNLCFMPVDYSVNGHVYRDFIQNISDSGLFIETQRRLCVGDDIMVSFAHPAFEFPIKVGGIIARSSNDGYGIRFKPKNGNGYTVWARNGVTGKKSEDTGIEMPDNIEAMLNAA
ncbi:MAG: PilZ domain-containing protein [Desulfobacterales bacterium]|nr:PilZ domain-containing protein [Desulfobacterales bacterium]